MDEVAAAVAFAKRVTACSSGVVGSLHLGEAGLVESAEEKRGG
jgi:hypothetical protein